MLKIFILAALVSNLASFKMATPAKAQNVEVSNGSQKIDRVPNVSELRDVYPGNWAYETLQSLSKRYQCIAKHSRYTEQNSQVITRYEFAVGLNDCLQHINKLLQENANISHEDIQKLQRLAKEFEVELAKLEATVENLENRVTSIEEQQFSTTTKLSGNVTMSALAYASGEGDRQTVLQHQTLLSLSTSFTGRDLLSTGFLATNTTLPELASSNQGREVGATREGLTTWAYGGDTNNNFILANLEYITPIIDNEKDKLYVTIAAGNGFNTSRYLLPGQTLTWEGEAEPGSGAISAFGQRNPIQRLGGGTGVIVNYDRGKFRLTGAYLATQANDPNSGKGLFNGDYLALAQLNYTPSERFALAVVYSNSYFSAGRFSFNNQYKSDDADSPGFVGTALANRFDNQGVFFQEDVPVVSNSYGIQAFYEINKSIAVGIFASKIDARLINRGDAEILTGAVSLAFPDLGKEGNLGGLIVGVEPTLTMLEAVGISSDDFERDMSLHIEAFYKHQINDNISVTPGVIWVTAPNQDANNEDVVLGVVRTTFSF